MQTPLTQKYERRSGEFQGSHYRCRAAVQDAAQPDLTTTRRGPAAQSASSTTLATTLPITAALIAFWPALSLALL